MNEEILSLIPEKKLEEHMVEHPKLCMLFPQEKQIDFIMDNPRITLDYPESDLFNLVDTAINKGKNDFVSVLDGERKQGKYLYHLRDDKKIEETIPKILRYMRATYN